MIFLAVLLCAFILTLTFTPLAMRFGQRMGLVDKPGGRRRHVGTIARTGGLALFAGFFITVFLTVLLPSAWLPPREDANEWTRLLSLLAGSSFCMIAGLLDDRYDFSSLPQYTVQLIASLIAISGLIFVKHVNNPFGTTTFFGEQGFPLWIYAPLTIFWFMGMMNTVNWLDGLSGLVTGVTAILCVILAVHMIFVVQPAQLSVALLPTALLGAALGFLPFNFGAKIFMGSSGSYFLGFAIAALGIIGGGRLATVMLVVGLPALDVAWLIVSRWRRGLSPNQGGRDHLHFRLIDLGFSERTIVIGYWLFCALFGLLTLLLDSRVYKLVALFGLGALALSVIIWASREHKIDQQQ